MRRFILTSLSAAALMAASGYVAAQSSTSTIIQTGPNGNRTVTSRTSGDQTITSRSSGSSATTTQSQSPGSSTSTRSAGTSTPSADDLIGSMEEDAAVALGGCAPGTKPSGAGTGSSSASGKPAAGSGTAGGVPVPTARPGSETAKVEPCEDDATRSSSTTTGKPSTGGKPSTSASAGTGSAGSTIEGMEREAERRMDAGGRLRALDNRARAAGVDLGAADTMNDILNGR